MNLAEVRQILEARVLCGKEWLSREVVTVCASDLLSDVLALRDGQTLLLTGLTNIQVIRTAELSDLIGIVFLNGKNPAAEMLSMAGAKKVPLLVTALSMGEACMILEQKGLRTWMGESIAT
jgi:predicted transcriptional regulator